MMKKSFLLSLMLSFYLSFGPVGLVSPSRSQTTVDNSIWTLLLEKYVKNSVVNYQGFKTDEESLNRYLKVLEKIDPDTLAPDEQFAFYVNAYNAWTIKLILGGYPGIKSIKDLGSLFKTPWKKKICRIDGDIITLDDIEHKILRARFKDPRVHFAINCASKSCPPLISEPYRGKDLDKQLDNSARSFINNSLENRIESGTLYVSKIFKWFPEDFNNDVVGFLLKYADGDFKKELIAKKGTLKIKYLKYDWSLNNKQLIEK
ncbi:hypothetical protein LCGC14_2771520 [marine sediment metagenome]|uniref:DUF547 domain-containing protein n=1 Tax=marine sediment metagenome TaxID=412755 RepID=A0A0F9B4Q9_9ZZZZ|nr:DUF547 domain-containing protein [Desulfobacterales bacterium]